MRSFIHLAQPLFGKEEKKEVIAALDSGWVTLGPKTKQFEEELAAYVGSKYAVAVSSCTAGLHLSLLAAGVGVGDEVITTIFTMAATSNTIIHSGATPVFVDIDKETFNIDPSKIEEKIMPKTKAILVMHYGGHPVDLNRVRKIAKKHKLIVIEDAATAIGAKYNGKKIGSISDMTVFSFHPIKNISTGDGGMITTNNKHFAERLSILRLHGMNKDAWKRHSQIGSWKYDIVVPGFKYNMTDIQAALGIHQLRKLERFIKIREKYAKMYDKTFSKIPEITIPFVSKNVRHPRNLYTVIIDFNKLRIKRDELIEELKSQNIGANAYYIPLYEFTYYKKKFGLKFRDFPVTNFIFNNLVTLPLHPKMKQSDVVYIIKILTSLIVKNRK